LSALDRPLVCICVPCYNCESSIHETLESILNQTYPNFIVKVFDNASTDGSLEIIKKFEKHENLEIHTSEKTVSGEENFNRCILAAEGKYMSIFHSDDVYHATIVEEEVNFLEANSDLSAVATNASIIDSESKIIGTRFLPPELLKNESNCLDYENLITLTYKYGNFVTCPSVMMKTDILQKSIKAFRGNLFKSSSDLDMWLRFAKFGGIGVISSQQMKYRVSTASYSFNIYNKRIEDHDLFLVLNHYIENETDEKLKNKLIPFRDFLLMKDRVKTNLNRVLSGDKLRPIEFMKSFKMIFLSRFHFKMGLVALSFSIIIRLPRPIRKIILSGIAGKMKFVG